VNTPLQMATAFGAVSGIPCTDRNGAFAQIAVIPGGGKSVQSTGSPRWPLVWVCLPSAQFGSVK
jgi:hypothetical protein